MTVDAEVKLGAPQWCEIKQAFVVVAKPVVTITNLGGHVVPAGLRAAIRRWYRDERRRLTNSIALVNLSIKESFRASGRPEPPDFDLEFLPLDPEF